MDAKIFGAFIAACRKEQNMTQAELAVQLHVTDKAVSRWERGVGFPDINTIEPLAAALGISVLELMKSERITENEVAKEEAAGSITDALSIAAEQRRQERKKAFSLLGVTAGIVIFVLFLDSMQWQIDAPIFWCVGVVFPLLCVFGSLVLLIHGIRQKAAGKPCGQTFALAFTLVLLLIILMGIFFLAGALGTGPVPN